MRFIPKTSIAPQSFINAVAGFEYYGALRNNDKQNVLEVLVNEQNGLCAYCQQKISKKDATVEHLICQSHNAHFDLEYKNLLAVCKGNEGVVETSHCDKFRANGASNDYFLPTVLFEKCRTENWDSINPFFDIEYNPRTQFVSGKLIAVKQNLKEFPPMYSSVSHAIGVLNLNAKPLVDARKWKWDYVKKTKSRLGLNWEDLFTYYLQSPSTDFHEFVLLAIRKQV